MLPWSIVMHTIVISQGRANAKLCMDCMNATERGRGRLQLCNCLKHSEMHRYDAYPSASERQRGSPKSTRWPFRVEWPDTSLDGVGHRRSDGTRMKLGGSDAKRDADTTDGPGKLSDASKRHRDAPDIRISVVTTAIAMQTINTCQDTAKLPNSPLEPEKWPTNDQAKSRNRAGTPNTCGQAQTVGRHAKMARDTRNRRYSIADSERSDPLGGSTRSCAEGTAEAQKPHGRGPCSSLLKHLECHEQFVGDRYRLSWPSDIIVCRGIVLVCCCSGLSLSHVAIMNSPRPVVAHLLVNQCPRKLSTANLVTCHPGHPRLSE